jgi:hypothetical protein
MPNRNQPDQSDSELNRNRSDEPDGPGGGVDFGGVAGSRGPEDAPGAGAGSGDGDGDDGDESKRKPRSGGASGTGPPSDDDSNEPDGPGGGVDFGGVAGSKGPEDAPGAGAGSGDSGGDSDGADATLGDLPETTRQRIRNERPGLSEEAPVSTGEGTSIEESPSDADRQIGPGPTTGGGLGEEEQYPVSEAVEDAEKNQTLVEMATTGGVLSQKPTGSEGLLPGSIAGTDVSEQRLDEAFVQSQQFAESIDVGATFGSPADPLGSGGAIRGQPGSPPGEDPADGPVESFVAGAARTGAVAPASAAKSAETATEVAQNAGQILTEFGVAETAETGAAVGRESVDRAVRSARSEPAEFAGGVALGAALGAGGLSRGASARGALTAEFDPRIGIFGETIESRSLSRFLDDDRGQADTAITIERTADDETRETADLDEFEEEVRRREEARENVPDEDLREVIDTDADSERRTADTPTEDARDAYDTVSIGTPVRPDERGATPDTDARDAADVAGDTGLSARGQTRVSEAIEAAEQRRRGVDPTAVARSDVGVGQLGATTGLGTLLGAASATATTTRTDTGTVVDVFARPGVIAGTTGAVGRPTDTDEPPVFDPDTSDPDSPSVFDPDAGDPDRRRPRDPDGGTPWDPDRRDPDIPNDDERERQRGRETAGFGGFSGASIGSGDAVGAGYFNEFVTGYAVGAGPREVADDGGGLFGRPTETQVSATGETAAALDAARATFFADDDDSDGGGFNLL